MKEQARKIYKSYPDDATFIDIANGICCELGCSFRTALSWVKWDFSL